MVAKGKPYSLVRYEFTSGKAQKGTVLEKNKSGGLTTQESGGKGEQIPSSSLFTHRKLFLLKFLY